MIDPGFQISRARCGLEPDKNTLPSASYLGKSTLASVSAGRVLPFSIMSSAAVQIQSDAQGYIPKLTAIDKKPEPIDLSTLSSQEKSELQKFITDLHLTYSKSKDLSYTHKTDLLICAVEKILKYYDAEQLGVRVNFGVDAVGVRRVLNGRQGLEDILNQLVKTTVEPKKLQAIAFVFDGLSSAYEAAGKKLSLNENTAVKALSRSILMS